MENSMSEEDLKSDPLVGRTLGGKFTLEARLGQGAMGTVYRARQIALDKTVAIKVMNRELLADASYAERFQREARAASRLDHPNSIRVFDFGEEGGLLYLAMELVEGRDLGAVLSDGATLAPDAIVDLLSQALSALAVAHDLGVLHRDLKPENIMVVRGRGEDGQPTDVVKVCDFGIAKFVGLPSQTSAAAASKHTTAGVVIGTPEYMSPEQARGEALDGRSDIYSLGVVLYELLAGRVPFQADSALGVVLKHVTEEPPPPSAHRRGVDAQLEALCMKALQKRPADRFTSAREMRKELRAAVSGTRPSSQQSVVIVPTGGGGRRPGSVVDAEKPTLVGVSPSTGPPRRARSRVVMAGLIALSAAMMIVGLRLERLRASAAEARGPGMQQPMARARVASEPVQLSTPVELQTVAASAPAAPPKVESAAPPTYERAARRSRGDRAPQATAPAAQGGAQPAATDTGTGSQALVLAASATSAGAPTAIVPALAPSPSPIAAEPASPTPTQAPPEPRAAPYDLAAARVEVGLASRVVGATASTVSRTVSEVGAQITNCYRAALPRLGAPVEGAGWLHVETDGEGLVTDARFAGFAEAALGRCIAGAVTGRRIANVDTGSATAEVPLTFKAH
jgi:serine/threonine-protein kinase